MNPAKIKPLLEWSDEYLIGVEELDYEHRDLISRLNELHEELTQHDEKDKIEACLREIQVRVAAHFALEEHYMLENKYKKYTSHKEKHDNFLAVIADLIEKFLTDPELSYGDELEEQLRHWISNHILTSDQDLASAKTDK